MKKLAIFASGGGSNALKIHEYLQKNPFAKIDCIVVNNPNAGIRAGSDGAEGPATPKRAQLHGLERCRVPPRHRAHAERIIVLLPF